MKRFFHTMFACIAMGSLWLFCLAGFLPHGVKIPAGMVAVCGLGLAALLGLAGVLLTETHAE